VANEVIIKVKADNQVKAGFESARKEATEHAGKIGKSLADGLTRSFGPVGGQLVAVLGVGVAAAAPMLGAAVSAAIVGGAAGTGVIGGLALAARDPRVKAMGISLGEEVMGGLEQRAEVFVGPALRGISKLRAGFREIGPDLDKIFENSSKYVDPLVDGLVSGSKKIISGVATAIGRAGPIIDQFSESFDRIGGAVGDAFETLSEDTEASAAGFDALTDAIVGTIGGAADLINALTKTFGALEQTDDAIDSWRHSLEDALSFGDRAGTQFDITADGMTNMERKAKEAAEANHGLADSSKDATSATQAHTESLKELADELRAETEPTFALLKATTDLGEARTKYGKAVKKYGADSAEARDELNNMTSSAIDLQGAVGELGAEFNGELSPSLLKTLDAAGFTKKEIAALAREFQATKRRAEDFEGTYQANVKVNGVPRAMAQLYGVRDIIRDIPRAVTIGLRITGTSNVSAQAASIRKNYAHGGIAGAASGKTMGDEWSWVGEGGPELVKLPVGSTVRSSGDSMRMMAAGQRAAGIGGGGGKMSLRADVDPTLENTLIGVLLRALRLEIGNQGGDVQTALGRA